MNVNIRRVAGSFRFNVAILPVRLGSRPPPASSHSPTGMSRSPRTNIAGMMTKMMMPT